MDKITQAVKAAVKAHAGQVRKGDGVTPYIVHPLEVSILVARYVKDDDVVAAAILHDVLEDTDYGRNKLRKVFGKRIFALVNEVSDRTPAASWETRRQACIEKLRSASKEACLIVCADKIHNLRSLEEAYTKHGEEIWERFSSSKEEKIAYYESIFLTIRKRFRCPIVELLGRTLKHTKKILHDSLQALSYPRVSLTKRRNVLQYNQIDKVVPSLEGEIPDDKKVKPPRAINCPRRFFILACNKRGELYD